MDEIRLTERVGDEFGKRGDKRPRVDSLACAVCSNPSSKYRFVSLCQSITIVYYFSCPRCDEPTCSLPCSKEHKAANNCSGKRVKTQFMRVSEMNDATFVNDLSVLHEVQSAAKVHHEHQLFFIIIVDTLETRFAAKKGKESALEAGTESCARAAHRSEYLASIYGETSTKSK